MEKPRVLFISQEILPYLPESQMGTICRYLPQGTQERKKEIRTFMPRFGNINERRNQLHEVIRLSGMNLIIDDNDHPVIAEIPRPDIRPGRKAISPYDKDIDFHEKVIEDIFKKKKKYNSTDFKSAVQNHCEKMGESFSESVARKYMQYYEDEGFVSVSENGKSKVITVLNKKQPQSSGGNKKPKKNREV